MAPAVAPARPGRPCGGRCRIRRTGPRAAATPPGAAPEPDQRAAASPRQRAQSVAAPRRFDAPARPADATAARTSDSGTPTQPDSRREYSGRRAASRIRATSGAALRTAATRPSAVLRSNPATAERIAKANSGVRERDQLADRAVAAGQPELARVHVVRGDRDERLGHEALVTLEGPQGRLLPGGVTVEREDHLPAEGVAVDQVAGAARRHGPGRTPCHRWPPPWSPPRGARPSRRCTPRRPPPA